MNYWFTTHWPPREDEQQDRPPTGVWIPDGKIEVADRMNAGDLVFVYQSLSGPTRIIKYTDGTTKEILSRRGRQGVVALCEITDKPYQPDWVAPEQYTGGKTRWWRYCAPIKGTNSTGFVSRVLACKLLGYSENYNFRGFGTANSGIKEIDEETFFSILKAFIASSESAAQQVAKSIQDRGFGPGGEGPVHLALKKRIAEDPSGVLNEPGLVLWKLEYSLPTGDRIDVTLKDKYGRFVVVEVEVDCPDTELIGPLQCMKYRAMIAYAFQQPLNEVTKFFSCSFNSERVQQHCSQYDIETHIVSRIESDFVYCRSRRRKCASLT